MVRKRWVSHAVVVAFSVAAMACAGDAEEDTMDDAELDNGAAVTPTPDPGTSGAVPVGELPAGVTAEMVAEGQQVFSGPGICISCHGPDASGTPLAPNLRDNEWLWVTNTTDPTGMYNEIVTRVQEGVPTPKTHPSPMPPMGGAQLTEDQVRAVAAYVYSLSHGG